MGTDSGDWGQNFQLPEAEAKPTAARDRAPSARQFLRLKNSFLGVIELKFLL